MFTTVVFHSETAGLRSNTCFRNEQEVTKITLFPHADYFLHTVFCVVFFFNEWKRRSMRTRTSKFTNVLRAENWATAFMGQLHTVSVFLRQ